MHNSILPQGSNKKLAWYWVKQSLYFCSLCVRNSIVMHDNLKKFAFKITQCTISLAFFETILYIQLQKEYNQLQVLYSMYTSFYDAKFRSEKFSTTILYELQYILCYEELIIYLPNWWQWYYQ